MIQIASSRCIIRFYNPPLEKCPFSFYSYSAPPPQQKSRRRRVRSRPQARTQTLGFVCLTCCVRRDGSRTRSLPAPSATWLCHGRLSAGTRWTSVFSNGHPGFCFNGNCCRKKDCCWWILIYLFQRNHWKACVIKHSDVTICFLP